MLMSHLQIIRISRHFITILLSLALLLIQLNSSVQADDSYQPVNEIHQLVLRHIEQKVGQRLLEPKFEIRELSRNLKLAKCQSGLKLSDRNPDSYAGRMTIGVSCTKPAWKVYIPANVSGKIKVVATTRAILKKGTIHPEDLKEMLVPYRKVPSQSLTKIETALGLRTKRAIGAGKILNAKDLQPPYLVFKKRIVNIVTKIGSIEVKTRGVSQANAVLNEQVNVKNSASGKIVKGIVIAPNTVYVP